MIAAFLVGDDTSSVVRRRRADARRTTTPTRPRRARRAPDRPGRRRAGGPGGVLRPAARVGGLRRQRVRAARRCRSTTLEPDGDNDRPQPRAGPGAPTRPDRVGSVVVNPGGPGAPGTTMAENATGYFRPSCSSASTSSPSTRAAPASPTRSTACPTPTSTSSSPRTPRPTTPPRARRSSPTRTTFFAGCVAELRRARRPRLDRRGRPRHGRAARGAGRGAAELPRVLLRHDARVDVRRSSSPKNVGRFVLDGATDPTLDFRDNALSQAAGFQTALDAYVDDCVGDGDCFLGDDRAAALARSTTCSTTSRSSRCRPTRTATSRSATRSTASSPRSTAATAGPTSTRALQEALDGSGNTLLLLSDLYGSRNAGGGYDDNSLEAILAHQLPRRPDRRSSRATCRPSTPRSRRPRRRSARCSPGA